MIILIFCIDFLKRMIYTATSKFIELDILLFYIVIFIKLRGKNLCNDTFLLFPTKLFVNDLTFLNNYYFL